MTDKPIQDVGWINDWYANPPAIVKTCRELKHKTREANLDPTHHGYHSTTTCDECGYIYHCDSSD